MYPPTPPEIRDLARYARCTVSAPAPDELRLEMLTLERCICAWLPYSVKDLFRRWFPGALWMPAPGCWMVGLHQHERLEQWMQTVRDSGVLDDLAARRARALDDAELRRLAEELAELRRQIAVSMETAIPELRRRALAELHRELAALRAGEEWEGG
jgi:hypothetical protein